MPSVIGKRLAVGFGLAIVLLIGNAYVSFRATNTLIENNRSVVQTQRVIETLSEAVAHITTAETSQRGYIITGDESFLEFYNETLPRIERSIAQLKELTRDNPAQHERLAAFEKAVAVRRETLDRNLELRKSEGVNFWRGSERLQQGREQMDDVRRVASEIQGEENSMLALRTRQSDESARNTTLTFLTANALVLALLGAVYYVAARDLAERQRAAERLREANDQLELRVEERTHELADTNTELERSNRELQDFAFVASHDLQEPLRKIQAFGDRLKTKHGPQLNEEARDYLYRMQNAASRMHTLINDLLTFSRVTTKAQPFERTDLNKVAEDVLNDLEVRLQDTGGTVDVAPLPTIYADRLQMSQLFQNLIGNALKFHRTGEAPIIKIRAEVTKKGGGPAGVNEVARLTVQDNGIGFDEKYLDRIFTPFQRLHGRGEYEGTGIGLAVCRKIVERHRGNLTAESRPGEGSTFIITLPVNQQKEQS